MNWNHDISQALRGKMVHSTRAVGDRVHEISDFVADHIWADSKCGKVIKSYWIPPVGKAAGRWSGFATGEAPIAWQHFVVPEHPFQEHPHHLKTTGGDDSGTLKGSVEDHRQAAGRSPESQTDGTGTVTAGETATQFYLEDVGGGA